MDALTLELCNQEAELHGITPSMDEPWDNPVELLETVAHMHETWGYTDHVDYERKPYALHHAYYGSGSRLSADDEVLMDDETGLDQYAFNQWEQDQIDA